MHVEQLCCYFFEKAKILLKILGGIESLVHDATTNTVKQTDSELGLNPALREPRKTRRELLR
jgi:hypothetical protein